jgi:hypothetical protein
VLFKDEPRRHHTAVSDARDGFTREKTANGGPVTRHELGIPLWPLQTFLKIKHKI